MKEVTYFITRAASTYLQILTFSYLYLGPVCIDIIVLFLFFFYSSCVSASLIRDFGILNRHS